MMNHSKALFGAVRAAASVCSAAVSRPLSRAFAVTGVCAIALVGCNSLTSQDSSSSSSSRSSASLGPGGGDGINDAALGVAASPRVTDQQTNLPRGGGRAQVGRPYRIGGILYTPREDPNYDRVGEASWYGDAFHGRLTANGEVYDMHTLSAAHPTLPLPSYVRVTNVENNHSVVVRVNDRGPFSRSRIIDLSSRAADVLDFRSDGIARVRVQYEGAAPLHGQDVAWLEATAQVNGVPNNGLAPGTMLARAPVPAPAPVAAPTQAAFAATSDVATPAPVATQPQQPSFLDTLFGRQPVRQPQPAFQQQAAPTSPPVGAPVDLSPPATAVAVPVAAQNVPAYISPAFGNQGPVPSALIGFMPANLEDGFTQRNRSVLAQQNRIDLAHRAANSSALDAATNLALQSQTVATLRQRQTQSVALAMQPQPLTGERTALVQIGIFGDPANVSRVSRELSNLGQVVTTPLQSGNRTLTQVRLRAVATTAEAERDLLRTLARQGYTDAYVTQASNG